MNVNPNETPFTEFKPTVEEAEPLAHLINDEVDAHKINDELSQVAETFDALDAAGEGVDMPNPELELMQDRMAKYMSSIANHQPGKEFKYEDVTFTVQAHPHNGCWTRNEKKVVMNPNLKNNSVRRKLAKNPTKYTISIF
jgi:hypothetical protein